MSLAQTRAWIEHTDDELQHTYYSYSNDEPLQTVHSFESNHVVTSRIETFDSGVFLENSDPIPTPPNNAERYHILLMYPTVESSQFCALESLVRSLLNHSSDEPDRLYKINVEIFVWMSKPILNKLLKEIGEIIEKKKEIRKIKVRLIKLNFFNVVKNTGFELFYQKLEKDRSLYGQFGKQNQGNALRLAILRKFGGFYIDSDMLSINDPTILPDGMSKQRYNQYNNAAMKLHHKNKYIIDILIDDFINKYNGNIWGNQGPNLLTRVFRKQCFLQDQPEIDGMNERMNDITIGYIITCPYSTQKYGKMYSPPTDTSINKYTNHKNTERAFFIDINIWPIRQLFPIPYWEVDNMNKTYAETAKIYNFDFNNKTDVIFVHLWHKKTNQYEKMLCEKHNFNEYRNSFLGGLRQQTCPLVLLNMEREKSCQF